MTGGAYYNEIDPFSAAWLRALIEKKLIADGVVDERSITEVKAEDLKGFTQCHFFAGIGVWSAALRGAGWADGDRVWTGSCPCQPFSAGGAWGGFDDQRHLWPAWFGLIREHRPDVIFGEQVASPDGLAWFDVVSTELETESYAIGAADICAAGVGAPHVRQRLYFVADADGARLQGLGRQHELRAARGKGEARRRRVAGDVADAGFWHDAEWIDCTDGHRRPIEPGTFPLAHGAAARVGRLRGYGNALCKPQAEVFIKAFMTL